MIEIEELHRLFLVDGGRLIRRVRTNNNGGPAGGEAGARTRGGYVAVKVAREKLYVHRIIWAMTHSRWPSDQIDHINGVRSDNRPENLREATGSQNQHNTGKRRANSSGVKGASWHKSSGKWQAKIRVNGKTLFLGYYDDPESAGYAYMSAALKHHAEFARAP